MAGRRVESAEGSSSGETTGGARPGFDHRAARGLSVPVVGKAPPSPHDPPGTARGAREGGRAAAGRRTRARAQQLERATADSARGPVLAVSGHFAVRRDYGALGTDPAHPLGDREFDRPDLLPGDPAAARHAVARIRSDRHRTVASHRLPGRTPQGMMMKTLLATIAALCAAGAVLAQQPLAPSFDAVSIKANRSGEQGGSSRGQPGRYVGVNVTLMRLVRLAYRPVEEFDGGPEWKEKDRFDIEAVSGASPSQPQMLAMLRTLLADRFKLRVHTETARCRSTSCRWQGRTAGWERHSRAWRMCARRLPRRALRRRSRVPDRPSD